MLFRMAKLKGITSGPPSICGDVEETKEEKKKSKRASKNMENEDEKYIDYKGMYDNNATTSI